MLAIGAVVILILLGLFLTLNKKTSSPTGQTPNQETGKMETTKGSIANLLARTGSTKCTYSYTPSGTPPSSGTVYVANGKMNGEFQTVVAGKQTTMYMINDGTYSYTWGGDMPEGIKMKNPETSVTPPPTTNETTKYVNTSLEYDFKCGPWITDTSKFTPPTTITFRDMSAMMENVQKQMGTTDKSQCGACASLTGDAQAQCKKALGCQ